MAVSNRGTPTSSTSKSFDSHSETVLANKRKPGRKPTPDSLIDEEDLEHLRVPFTFGWKRELVYRNTTVDPSNRKLMCDIYYFLPNGKKLRSMVEISTYLESQKNSPVNLTHFTFKRTAIFKPPHETVRTAGRAFKKLHNVAAFLNGAEKQTKSKICYSNRKNSDKHKNTIEVNQSERSIGCEDSVNQLATAADDFAAAAADGFAAAADGFPSPKVTGISFVTSTPNLQIQVPITVSKPRGRPKGSLSGSGRGIIKRCGRGRGRQRTRRWSPDWTPDSDEYSRSPVPKRNVEVITDSLESSHSCDDEDSDLQNVFGTPSKLIASIVRPEPQKRPLDINGGVTAKSGKKMKIVINPTTQRLSVCTSSTPTLVGNCTAEQSKFLIANSHLLTTPSTHLKMTSSVLPALKNIKPSHQCEQCGQRYHIDVAGLGTDCTNKSLCVSCGSAQMNTMLLSSRQHSYPQQNLLKLVSSSMATEDLSCLSTPVVLSPCVVPVSSLSSNFSKSISTPSTQLLPQVLSPIFLISGQNAVTTIPPPPPLASCPRFDSPVTLLPLHFTSEVPPPPRLQLCSIPQVSQPPPLLLAGSILPACSQTSSFLTQLPTLQSCPILLSSKPATFQPTVTTSSQLKFVSKISKTSADIPSVNIVMPSQVVSKLVPLTATALQTPLVTTTLKLSSQTSAVAQKHGRNGKSVHDDTVPPMKKQASDNVRCAVKNLLNKRVRALSSSSSSDIDDYPPVIFGPVDTENAAHLFSQTETAATLEASHCAVFDNEHHSNFQTSNKALLRQDHRLYSSGKPSRMIKDILNRTNVDQTTRLPSSLPTAWIDESSVPNSHILPDLNGKTVNSINIETQSNSQFLTLPHPLLSRLDSNGAVTLTIGGTDSIVQPLDIYSSSCTAQSLFKFDVFQPTNDFLPVSEKMPIISTQSRPEKKPSEETKMNRRNFLNSFRMLQTSFTIMMKIFRHLSIPDLLRACCVCKVWHILGTQSCLWRRVFLEGVRIRKWEEAAQFFIKVGVKSLNLKGAMGQENGGIVSVDLWDIVKRTIPTVTCLEELFFDQVPASILDTITEKMPHLVNIGAESITESDCFSSTPMLSAAKTVESMSHAVEAVTSGRMSTNNAARLFRVSEKDLIHLTQRTAKLTSDEETAVLLSCLRLSRMGFAVQKDIVMGKCQEMFARRYLSTSPIPISDSYCKDLYYRNVPLFTAETDIKSTDTLLERLDFHYCALRRLYNSLWPRTTLSANQVLAFDLKSFRIDKEPGLNSLRSVAVTVLSVISACSRFLPVMTVWPKLVEATHPDLVNVMSKRGIPSFLHVFQYFKKILNLIKERPLVILCNGNASLLSEKLISTCVSDSVYLYCVPPDVAKYVFPGCHGGMLHMLKTQMPDSDLKCGEFATKLLSLLKFKKKSFIYSTKLAFTTTGAFSLNSRAPMQYQAVDSKISTHQSFLCRKNGNLPGLQQSQSSNDGNQLAVEKSGHGPVSSETTENQTETREGIVEQDTLQLKDETISNQAKPDLIVKTVQTVTRARKKEHKKFNVAQILGKKILDQTRNEQNSSQILPLKIMTSSLPAVNNVSDNSKRATRSDDKTDQKQSTADQHISDIYPTKSLTPLQICHTTKLVEVTPVEKLVDHTAETNIVQSDVVVCNDSLKYSLNERLQISSAECEMSTNLTIEKQTLTDIDSTIETNQIQPPSKSSICGNHTANNIMSHVVDSNGPSTVLVKNSQQSSNNNNEDLEDMETDSANVIRDTLNMADGNVAAKNEDMAAPSSLNEVSSSVRNKHKQRNSKRDVNSKRLLLASNKSDIDKDKESVKNITVKKLRKTKKVKKNVIKQNILETSHTDLTLEKKTSTSITTDISSDNKCKDNANVQSPDKEKIDTQEKKLRLLSQLSLIDHDYIMKCEGTSNKSDDNLVSEVVFGLSESCDVPGDQIEKTNNDDCVLGHEDVIHFVDEDVAETLVCSQNCDSIEETSRSGDDSSNIGSECSNSSGTSNTNHRETSIVNGTEDNSSSDSTDSSMDNEESDSSDDDDKKPSELEEEEDEDDDSKCQMCMRSTPPHSKDKIINWVDCDGNCGRWFHVICVARSQSKTGTKHFICPSCRCKR